MKKLVFLFFILLNLESKSQVKDCNCCYSYDLYKCPEKINRFELFGEKYTPKIDSCLKLAKNLNYLSYLSPYFNKIPGAILDLPKLDTLKITLKGNKIQKDFYKLNKLTYLALFCKGRNKIPTILKKFHNLTYLEIDMEKYYQDKDLTLSNLNKLKFLSVALDHWVNENNILFENLEFIELYLKNSNSLDLNVISNAKKLKAFVGNIVLDSTSIEIISRNENLKALSVHKHSINDINQLRKLKFLEVILIKDLSSDELMKLKKILPNTYIDNEESTDCRGFYFNPSNPLYFDGIKIK